MSTKLLLLGLQNSGKSSILHKLQTSKNAQDDIKPTGEYSVSYLNRDEFGYEIVEISGAPEFRSCWKYYQEGAKGVVFVVDSGNSAQIEAAKKALHFGVYAHMSDVTHLLVYANKQDLPAMRGAEVRDNLEIQSLFQWRCRVQECSARYGVGVEEGFNWLCQQLQ